MTNWKPALRNKLNFMNWRSYYLKIFDRKVNVARSEINCTPVFIWHVPRHVCAIACLKWPGLYYQNLVRVITARVEAHR